MQNSLHLLSEAPRIKLLSNFFLHHHHDTVLLFECWCAVSWTCSTTEKGRPRSHEPKIGDNKQLLVTDYFEVEQVIWWWFSGTNTNRWGYWTHFKHKISQLLFLSDNKYFILKKFKVLAWHDWQTDKLSRWYFSVVHLFLIARLICLHFSDWFLVTRWSWRHEIEETARCLIKQVKLKLPCFLIQVGSSSVCVYHFNT